MRVAVVSGKGGAGKTSVAVSLALIKGRGTVVDCDVEEPNVALFLCPEIAGREVATKPVPRVDHSRCDFCKACAEACQFNALMVLPKTVVVFEKLCHACGTCSYVCPKDAIYEEERPIGEIEWGKRGAIGYLGGRLNVGEAMATPLISQLKKRIPEDDFVVLDAPPGVTCPTVETVDGADYVLIVAESSVFGLSDFKLVLEYVVETGIPFGVLENKVGFSESPIVEEFCRSEGLPFLGGIPFSRDVASAYSEGVVLADASPDAREVLEGVLESIEGASCER